MFCSSDTHNRIIESKQTPMSESLVCQCQITSQSLFGGGLGLLPQSSHQSSHDEASGGTPAPACLRMSQWLRRSPFSDTALPPLMPAHPCSMRITGKLKAQSVAARKELTRPLGVPTCQTCYSPHHCVATYRYPVWDTSSYIIEYNMPKPMHGVAEVMGSRRQDGNAAW